MYWWRISDETKPPQSRAAASSSTDSESGAAQQRGTLGVLLAGARGGQEGLGFVADQVKFCDSFVDGLRPGRRLTKSPSLTDPSNHSALHNKSVRRYFLVSFFQECEYGKC